MAAQKLSIVSSERECFLYERESEDDLASRWNEEALVLERVESGERVKSE